MIRRLLRRERVRRIIQRHELGSYRFRLSIDAVDRPHYAHLVYHAAQLAAKLGLPSISVLEYGVAGGNGLLCLEKHAAEAEKLFRVRVEVYGFDTGEGLPAPVDYRDLPYHWKQGFFRMDQAALKAKLTRARLVLGDIRDTARSFFDEYRPAPVGAMVHDFDFYSSTAEGLRMLEADEKYFLPRVFCYFDDTIGDEVALLNDFTGQRLAINEFNERHDAVKLCAPYYLLRRRPHLWHRQIWVCHFFRHSRYNAFVSHEDQQLRIDGG